jgi:hypothetical protein
MILNCVPAGRQGRRGAEDFSNVFYVPNVVKKHFSDHTSLILFLRFIPSVHHLRLPLYRFLVQRFQEFCKELP